MKAFHATALNGIKKYVPSVETVVDAKDNATFEVSKDDVAMGRRKAHNSCVAARACKRKFNLDAVVVSRRMIYFVKDKKATRYILPESVTREIIAFDRGGKFATGVYEAKKPHGSMKLGTKRGPHPTKRKGIGPKKAAYRHLTAGIRAAL